METKTPNFIVVAGRGITAEQFGDSAEKVIIEDGRQLWGAPLERFRSALVLLVYASVEEQMQALIAARQLVKVASELRIAGVDAVDGMDGDAIYQQAHAIPDYISHIDDESFLTLVQRKRDIIVHRGQDSIDGVHYYDVKINRERYILDSEHNLIPVAGAAAEGILLAHNDPVETRMSHDAVFSVFFESKPIDSGALFRKIRNYIHEFIYLPSPEMFDVMTVWVMGTYVHSIFRYYPYLHLHAEKGSGKTLLMEVLAPICFNGVIMASPNGNSLLRLIKRDRATIFIDEAESFAGASNGSGELSAILNTGFNSSGDVVRGKEHFPTYGPKVIASINPINDVLAGRVIGIRLMRKTVGERTYMYRETPEILLRQQRMRDGLYLFGLQHAEAIGASYNKAEGAYDSLPHLTNRAFDIWVPLYKIAGTIGDDDQKHEIFISLDKYSQKDDRRRANRDADENESTHLLMALGEMMTELKPVRVEDNVEYYDPDAVHFFLQRSGYLASGMQKKSLSRLLNRTLEIESVPKAFGELTKRMYAINRERMADYRKRYLK